MEALSKQNSAYEENIIKQQQQMQGLMDKFALNFKKFVL